MGYLFFQILAWLLLAFGLGGVVGWLLRGFTHALQDNEKINSESLAHKSDHIIVTLMKKELHAYKERLAELESRTAAQPKSPVTAKPKRVPKVLVPVDEAWRPKAQPMPSAGPDDLKVIRGIGPKIEQTLHQLGIYRLEQIAKLTPENAVWLDRHLKFPGRVGREKWVLQARNLLQERAAG